MLGLERGVLARKLGEVGFELRVCLFCAPQHAGISLTASHLHQHLHLAQEIEGMWLHVEKTGKT